MLTRWGNVDSAFAWMDELRRRMDLAFQEFDAELGYLPTAGWPRANLYDVGSELLVQAEVPGLSEEDLQVVVTHDALTLGGERKSDVPEGYSAHRQERSPVRFSRTFGFPCKVDPEKVSATLRDGLLTVRLSKAPDAQPRRISVKAH